MPFEMENARKVGRGGSPPPNVGRRAEINVGHACNNRCAFCMQASSGSDHKKWVPLDKMKQELEYYRGLGMTELGILGGEPTLYPWLLPALEHAKGLGFSTVTINSNGTRFADGEFTRACAQAGVTRFCLSIHSHRAEVEDELCGRKGAFLDKLRGIRNMLKLKQEGLRIENISLNPVLNRLNMEDITGFVAFFKKLGISDIRFNAIRPEGGAENNQRLVPRYGEMMPHVLAAMLANERDWRITLTFGELPLCLWPQEVWRNAALRNKYLGEMRDTPTNVTEFVSQDEDGRRRFLWQDLKCDVLKTLTGACRSCALVDRCGGVWKNYVEMYGEGEFRPFASKE